MNTNPTPSTTPAETRRFVRFDRRLLAGLIAAVAAAAFLTQAALARRPAPTVPAGLQPPPGNKVYLVGHGVGVQIFACDGAAWSFVAPRANLFADNGQLIITHFAGPSWQARDGSTVVGRVMATATVDPTAIPWLLLSAVPAPDSKSGRLHRTTFIQRVATTGGLAPPASECNATTAGTEKEVAYTADYYVWK